MIWTFLRSTFSILNLGSTCCVTNASASCPLKPEPFGKGRVCSLVSSEIEIKDKRIRVEGVAWGGVGSRTQLYFSPDGYLVRYTTKVLGKTLEGRLRTLPPPGLDNAPVEFASDRVREIKL